MLLFQLVTFISQMILAIMGKVWPYIYTLAAFFSIEVSIILTVLILALIRVYRSLKNQNKLEIKECYMVFMLVIGIYVVISVILTSLILENLYACLLMFGI